MKKASIVFLAVIAIAMLAMMSSVHKAEAKSEYFDTQYCSICHYDDSSTCNGCHAHGVHSDSGKSDINLTATTDKNTYSPGETINVTIDGGYRNGWVRALLYDESGNELARSEGPGGTGSGEEFFISMTATAPETPGTYTWSASWYGNQYDKSGATFGNWVPDPGNSNHGEEVVSTNSFTVEASPSGPVSNIGVFKDHFWYLDSNGNDAWDNGSDQNIGFGKAGDIPVTGDWDNNGNTEIGLFRDGYWHLDSNGNDTWDADTDMTVKFGRAGDIPVTGDWDGNGVTDVGLFRDGFWYLDDGDGSWNQGSDTTIKLGKAGDIPVTGDWNGDGVTEIGLFRDGFWYLDDGDGIWGSGPDVSYRYGKAGDTPVTGDWNGDGVTDIGLFRDGFWYLDDGDCAWDAGTDAKIKFGNSTHTPVVGVW